MRLIKIADKKKEYRLYVETSIKLFGLHMWKKTRIFQKKKPEGNWMELPNKTSPSKKFRKKLNFWLSNHQKFVTVK